MLSNPFYDELLGISLAILGPGVLLLGVLVCWRAIRLSPWVKLIAAGLIGLAGPPLLLVLNRGWELMSQSQPWTFTSRAGQVVLAQEWVTGPRLDRLILFLELEGLVSAALLVVGLWGLFRDVRRRLDAYHTHMLRLSGAPEGPHGPARPWQPE
jgi:hypothetical protein